jgi:hypothetical protein
VERSWQDPSTAWWAKGRRASKHIDDIGAILAEFDPSTAYRVDCEPTGETGKTALRLSVLRSVPVELLTTIGDALHNMRSCLDSVAFELALRTLGKEMTDRQQKAVQFPVCIGRTEFDEFLSQKSQRDLYGEHERNALRCAQPFALREEASELGVEFVTSPQEEYRINELARLSQLNNLDKHRYLPLLAWYVDFPYFTNEVPPCRLRIRQHMPLGDGETIGHILFDETKGDPSPSLHLRMGLTFADDPGYATDFLGALKGWHTYLTGWILPRIFIVADGRPPPIAIGS